MFQSCTKGTTPRRLNVNRHMEGLKGEFESMVQEIESLRKERDGYRAKFEAKAKELEDVRRNFVCERCQNLKGSIMGAPQISISSQLRTSKTFKPVPPCSSPEKPGRSGTLRKSDPSQLKKSTRRPTTSIVQTLPTQPSESVGGPITTTRATSSPRLSVSTVGDSPKEQLIISNNLAANKELDAEIVHVLSHQGHIGCVNFSRDGKYLAAGCSDGKSYIYGVEAGTLICVLRNLLLKEDRISAVCFSHDGKYLATNSSDRNVYIWEIKMKYVRNTFNTFGAVSLDFSPNGRLVVSSSRGNTVQLWDMRSGAAKVLKEDVSIPPLPHGNFSSSKSESAVFSPDGRYVASSHFDGKVRIWDIRSGQLIRRVMSHQFVAYCVGFMPDGMGLVSGSYDGSLKYWDISSLYSATHRAGPYLLGAALEEPEREFLGHTDCIYSLSISPDGRWVASGACSEDSNIRIWNTHNAAMQYILNHDDAVMTVDFSPAGGFLASGDCSGVVKLWKYSAR